ncbi:MAG: hypothetical protein ACK4Q4_00830 [Rhodocyclaceae bacterium]
MQRQVDRHIAAMGAAFGAQGYKVQLNEDPQEYRRCVADIHGYSLTSPLDSAFVDVDEHFLWLRVSDAAGQLVGVEVGRWLKAAAWHGGLNGLLLNGSFFGDRRRVLPVLRQPPTVNLSGSLGYMGGAWISPDHRGRGLMSLIAKLTMAHLLRCFEIETIFGFIRQHHIGLALALDGYGFNSATELRWAYWAGSAAPESLYMIWIDRQALLERFEADPVYELKPLPKTGGKPT